MIDGKELVPAGASGMGEVVFTKKSGMAGSGGELILAARWLDVGGRHMRLRSLRLGGAGKDFTRSVDNFNMAAAASFPPLALLGFMVSGSEIAVARGAIAEAKIAEGFPIDSPAVAASPVAALAAVAVGNVALAMPAQIAVSTTSKITKGGVSQ